MSNETIKTIKGFDGNLKCRGMQYEIGKTYKLPKGEEPELCERGFHAISDDVSPLEVFDYYAPGGEGGKPSRYCKVELSGTVRKGTDKFASSEISIGAEIGIMGLIKAHFDWVKRHITNENNAEKGKVASAGKYGAASAGDCGAASSRGSSEVGDNGLAVVRGNGVKIKGGLGSILVIAEENDNDYNIKDWKAVVVDGETVKADTWYRLVDGKLKEVED